MFRVTYHENISFENPATIQRLKEIYSEMEKQLVHILGTVDENTYEEVFNRIDPIHIWHLASSAHIEEFCIGIACISDGGSKEDYEVTYFVNEYDEDHNLVDGCDFETPEDFLKCAINRMEDELA